MNNDRQNTSYSVLQSKITMPTVSQMMFKTLGGNPLKLKFE